MSQGGLFDLYDLAAKDVDTALKQHKLPRETPTVLHVDIHTPRLRLTLRYDPFTTLWEEYGDGAEPFCRIARVVIESGSIPKPDDSIVTHPGHHFFLNFTPRPDAVA